MSKHSSVVGGSTAGRVLACNYSIDLNRNLPQEAWNIYAATGSALHEVMELCLRNPTIHKIALCDRWHEGRWYFHDDAHDDYMENVN